MKEIIWFFINIWVFMIDGAKILIYTPSVSPSHIVMSGRMADVLVEAGHDVVLFIPEYDSSVTMNGTNLAKVWRMKNISDVFKKGFEEIGVTMFEQETGTPEDRLIFEEIAGEMCEAVMARHEELNVIKNYGFDLVFTEMIDLCGLGIMRFLGIKNHIWHSTTPLHDYVAFNLGVPIPISYVPTTEENMLGPIMSFVDRAYNLYMYLVTLRLHYYGTDKATEAIRKYAGSNFPSVRQIASESTIAFVNSDEFLDAARPILHKTVYIGGLGIGPPKPLKEPFSTLMQKSKKGVILFSLGTLAPTSLLKMSIKKEIVELFSEFEEYQFIVKVDKDDDVFIHLAKNVKNIQTTSWMPQSDILGDPRIKLFIMHGGYNSLLETSIRGVPVIVIPLFADQFKNAKTIEYRNLGVIVKKTKLGKHSLKNAMNQVLFDGKYKQAALRLSHLIKTKPFKPNELFLKWTNFVAETGLLPELTPEGAKLSFIQYFCLDVIFLFVSIPLLFIYCLGYILRRIYFMFIKAKQE